LGSLDDSGGRATLVSLGGEDDIDGGEAADICLSHISLGVSLVLLGLGLGLILLCLGFVGL